MPPVFMLLSIQDHSATLFSNKRNFFETGSASKIHTYQLKKSADVQAKVKKTLNFGKPTETLVLRSGTKRGTKQEL